MFGWGGGGEGAQGRACTDGHHAILELGRCEVAELVDAETVRRASFHHVLIVMLDVCHVLGKDRGAAGLGKGVAERGGGEVRTKYRMC